MTEHVGSSGPQNATYAIVGEAPGAEERRQGRPFVGPSGRLLRESLERVGLDPDQAYITNVYKEYRYGNPTPTPAEVASNRSALAAELAALPNLKAVLSLGNVPLLALTGKRGITNSRGVQDSEWVNVPVYATLHPAAILRNVRNKSDWLNDLASFGALVNTTTEDIEVVHVRTDFTITAMEAAADAAGWLGALDVETTIGDPFKGEMELISVCVTFDGRVVYALTPDDDRLLRKFVARMGKAKWIMHNGSFDLMVLRQLLGGSWRLAHDTMAMAYLLHPEEKKGLQILSGVYLGLPPYKDVDYKNIKDEPIEKVLEMNARDTARTYKLFRPLADELNQHPHLSRTYQWLLVPAISNLVDITLRGVPLDQERLAVLEDELATTEAEHRATLQGLVGPPGEAYGKPDWPKGGFNPGSPQQVAHVLYDQLGYPIIEKTEKGKPATGKAVLEKLAARRGNHPFIRALQGWRHVAKRISGSIKPWKELVDDNSRLHPRYKPTQVVTGRLSAELPNIQQVPREKAFRQVFGGVEGYQWVKADLSQIELRIAAFLAEETDMILAYQRGEDLHAMTAERVLGVTDVTTEFQPGKSARDAGKMLNFSLLYGAYPSKLIEIAQVQYGILLTKAEAERNRAIFFDSYPRLARWHSEVKAELHATGKSTSLLGRVRTFPEVYAEDEWVVKAAEREAINHPVQSLGSDLLVMGLNRLPEDVRKYAIVEVHDELGLLVPNHEVERVVPIVKATLEDVSWLQRWGIDFTVPVLAEVTAKEYWA